jgi:cytoskeletal protein CcmA (bactofilin family)
MTQRVGALREDVSGDPTAKCLAEISDLIGSKLAEPAPYVPPHDVWNSQPDAPLFDEEIVIEKLLDALPNESAIAFSRHQLEVLFSGGGPVLADTQVAATIIERFAHTCGCSFALHGETGTFTKNLIDTAASAQMNVPRSPIQIGFKEEKRHKMFGKSKAISHEEDKLLPPVQQLQNLAPAHLAASEPAANFSIGPGMTIVGKISSGGIVNVFGRVEGELNASTVPIPDGAQVEGTLAAQELTIGGRFNGTIHANQVTLTSSAVVEGEIHHRSLPIGENAWFAGVSRPKEASVSEDRDPPSLIQLVPKLNGSLAQPNFSPMLPALEPINELVFYCKRHGNGYRTPQGELPNVQYEPREFPVVYSVGSQDQSAKRISRGSLQIAIGGRYAERPTPARARRRLF